MLRVAIIGLGNVARIHLEAYQAVSTAQIVAGADPVEAQRAWARDTYGLKTYSDYEDMIARERPDLVCVLTPAQYHCSASIFAMNNGCNVLCEKPLALTISDAELMKRVAEQNRVKFFYGASYRFLPALQEARRRIRQGEIGRVSLMTEEIIGGSGVTGRKEFGPSHYPIGGPGGSGSGLVDHGIHLFDTFAWLLDEKIKSVFGQGNIAGDAPVPEWAVLKFHGGAVGRLTYLDATFSSALPAEGAFGRGGAWGLGGYKPPGAWSPSPGEILVFGETGALRIQHYANYLYRFNQDGMTSIPLADIPTPDNFARQLGQAIDDITLDHPETVGIDSGIEALRALLGVYRSQTDNTPVDLLPSC